MKSILITGTSTGIGLACAQVFTKAGYRVFGSIRKEEDAQRVSKELGKNFIPLLFDVTNLEQIRAAVLKVQEILGENKGLDGLINNAGIAVGGPLQLLPMEDFRWQFDVNVFGLLQVTQAFLPLLGAQKKCPFPPGKIINMTSVAGKIAAPFMGAYAASKHAVEAISHSLRRELMLYGVDVIILGPGAVKTPIWDKGTGVMPEYAKGSDYEQALGDFSKYAYRMGQKGIDPNLVGELSLKIMETKHPKTRYPILRDKFKNWTLPRLLPDRTIDRALAKNLKLSPEQ
ncbi:MAG: SDR family oxidoreductase [Saprospiraceae bacterium]|nr:SDR family oxidoreductase [Saprospiraceae bacterium]